MQLMKAKKQCDLILLFNPRKKVIAMKKYLLDTSICSYLMANNSQVKAGIASLKMTDFLFTCTIVRGEILFGIERLPKG